jgi:ribosomal protein S18 acetylase RimI-like enzyme
MQIAAVRSTAVGDEAHVVDTMVLAFAADPIARWSWPDAQQYLSNMPALTRAFGGGAFAHGTAHCTGDYAGVALWLPPGVAPDEDTMVGIIERSVAESARADVFGIFEQMAHYHPTDPHWYLPLIGVDPAHQGRGCGGALLAFALAQCDRDGLPAYLESTNPRNIGLYRRHGFEELGTIQVGSSPPMVPMLRKARAGRG